MKTNKYILEYISQEDFEEHVLKTLKDYKESLWSVDLAKFNRNLVDPFKLFFDKSVLNKSYEEVIESEIFRQRDKQNNNLIGYFHQNIFRFFKNCEVPKKGWDIIFYDDKSGKTYYVEMKNKHNSMNSSSARDTYTRFMSHLLNSEDRENSVCVLVEIIAKKSADEPWTISIRNEGLPEDERIRRMSVDKFYSLVTGDNLAFKKLSEQLPITVEKLLSENKEVIAEKDTAYEELLEINSDVLKALYILAFGHYDGFEEFKNNQ